MSLILALYSCGIAAVAVYPWPSGQCNKPDCKVPSSTPGRAGHTPTIFSDIVNPLLDVECPVRLYGVLAAGWEWSVLFGVGWVAMA